MTCQGVLSDVRGPNLNATRDYAFVYGIGNLLSITSDLSCLITLGTGSLTLVNLAALYVLGNERVRQFKGNRDFNELADNDAKGPQFLRFGHFLRQNFRINDT